MHSFSILNDFSHLFVFSYHEIVSSLSGCLVQGWMAYNQFFISYGFSAGSRSSFPSSIVDPWGSDIQIQRSVYTFGSGNKKRIGTNFFQVLSCSVQRRSKKTGAHEGRGRRPSVPTRNMKLFFFILLFLFCFIIFSLFKNET